MVSGSAAMHSSQAAVGSCTRLWTCLSPPHAALRSRAMVTRLPFRLTSTPPLVCARNVGDWGRRQLLGSFALIVLFDKFNMTASPDLCWVTDSYGLRQPFIHHGGVCAHNVPLDTIPKFVYREGSSPLLRGCIQAPL